MREGYLTLQFEVNYRQIRVPSECTLICERQIIIWIREFRMLCGLRKQYPCYNIYNQSTSPYQCILSSNINLPPPSFSPFLQSATQKGINNLSQQKLQYTFNDIPMAQRITQHKNILIPHIHHPHTFSRMHPEEDQRTTFDHKFFIAPNRQTRPLGLTLRTSNQSSEKRFQPSFDHFNLSSMFGNKILDEEELNQFNRNKQGPPLEIIQTPTRKKTQNNALKQTEQTKHGHSQAKKSRPKQKGLRQLSQRAYEIVLNLRSASYKEVANKLVDELNNQKQSDQQMLRSRIEEKDQQNIKRRVYDALNVLIALGVLRKDGRKIVGDRSIKYKFDQSQKNMLAAQIQAKKQKLKNKKQEQIKQQTKLKIFPTLVDCNIGKNEESNKINMPFMILGVDPSSIEYNQIDEEGSVKKLTVRKEKSQLMKMDLDCYVQYKQAIKT